MAQQDEMLDPVTAKQDEPMAGIDRRDLDNGQAPLGVSCFSPKCRRYTNAAQSEAAQHKGQQPNQTEDEKQRQNESDVVNIHE